MKRQPCGRGGISCNRGEERIFSRGNWDMEGRDGGEERREGGTYGKEFKNAVGWGELRGGDHSTFYQNMAPN